MNKIIILLLLGALSLCCNPDNTPEKTPIILANNNLEETWRYDRHIQPILAKIFWENSRTENDTAKFTNEKGDRHIRIICAKKETNEYRYQGNWDPTSFIENYK